MSRLFGNQQKSEYADRDRDQSQKDHRPIEGELLIALWLMNDLDSDGPVISLRHFESPISVVSRVGGMAAAEAEVGLVHHGFVFLAVAHALFPQSFSHPDSLDLQPFFQ